LRCLVGWQDAINATLERRQQLPADRVIALTVNFQNCAFCTHFFDSLFVNFTFILNPLDQLYKYPHTK
jgi:hypothetical protein